MKVYLLVRSNEYKAGEPVFIQAFGSVEGARAELNAIEAMQRGCPSLSFKRDGDRLRMSCGTYWRIESPKIKP